MILNKKIKKNSLNHVLKSSLIVPCLEGKC